MRGALALGLALISGCYQQRTVERRDWPNLSGDQSIDVRTLAGAERKFNGFAFTTAGLAGWRQVDSLTRSDSVLIPLDSIAVVRVSEFDRRATLLLTAAAVTGAFIVIAQTRSDERPPPTEPPPSSCPFVYSFDGKKWVFDGETYAGAVARALERTDTDELEAIRPHDGRYRIRVKNERRETDYTDDIAFLVADHPRGTRVASDLDGNLHLVTNPTPAQTRQYGGDTIPSRAGWELAFPRPAADSVALVLRIRNTGVGPFALYHTLSLLGSSVYNWYASLDRQLVTRSVVRSWVEREGYLDVQLAASDTFASVARIPDVGAAIAKNEMVILDLRRVRGDTIRIRLESSPEMWILERAEVAEYVGRASVRQLEPVSVRDERGLDVSSLIAARDRKYHVTTRGSDVEFQYAAPPLSPGTERTVFLRATGFYYIETNDRAQPRLDIVQRIMSDRAFAQQYFAEEWVRAGNPPLNSLSRAR